MKISIIPQLKDNYSYLIECTETGQLGVIDPSSAAPVLSALNGRKLDFILNTHHHWDHVDGNTELKRATNCKVVCSSYDFSRIPSADIALENEQLFYLGKVKLTAFHIPGHTLGHVAYWSSLHEALFSGDTLFGLGCGRLFEGSSEQLFRSLKKLLTLPAGTKVYCGHEYTLNNAEFASKVDPSNGQLITYLNHLKERRQRGEITVPSTLETEASLNPFLRANDVTIRAQLNMPAPNFSELDVFTKLRELKDKF